MKFGFSERELVVGIAAAGTGYALVKGGLAGKLPTFGQRPAYVEAALGFLLLAAIEMDGTAGEIKDGIGVALIVHAAIQL